MNKNDLIAGSGYFERYIQLVEDIDVLDALHKYGIPYVNAEAEQFIRLGDQVYASGKWTVKDIIQHIIDAERVFSYRAMRIARQDKTPLPGFEEDMFAANARAGNRTLQDLLDEYYLVRHSTIALFRSFSDDMLLSEGNCSGTDVTVLAIGYTITGHLIHHVNVLKERYYPLIS